MTEEEAKAATEENLVITGLPKLPADGDITVRKDVNDDSLWVAHKTMGGVNGYGISSYTKNREWSLKFVEFATNYGNGNEACGNAGRSACKSRRFAGNNGRGFKSYL